jgi:hypothetical protein
LYKHTNFRKIKNNILLNKIGEKTNERYSSIGKNDSGELIDPFVEKKIIEVKKEMTNYINSQINIMKSLLIDNNKELINSINSLENKFKDSNKDINNKIVSLEGSINSFKAEQKEDINRIIALIKTLMPKEEIEDKKEQKENGGKNEDNKDN